MTESFSFVVLTAVIPADVIAITPGCDELR
jgi:hypothetical protein